jgi:DHA2 family methylenomycin A resistance protein-like MFS transporter
VRSKDDKADGFAYRMVIPPCVVIFLITLDATIVNVALPTIQKGLTVPTGSLGWTVESYAIVFAALMLSGGALADTFGSTRTFVSGVAIFGIGSLIDAGAPSFSLLVLGRIVQGVGAAICMPSALAVLRSNVPTRHLGRAIALWTFSASVAVSAGPILGGVLVQFVTWRSIFIINIPVVALAIYLLLPTLRQRRARSATSSRSMDIRGQVLYIAASGLLIGGLTLLRGGSGAAQWQVPVLLLVLAAGGLYALYRTERRAASPILPTSLMKNRAFQSAAIIGGVVSMVNFGLMYCLGLTYGAVHGFSALKTGLFFLPTMLAVGVATTVVGRTTRALGERATVIAGLVLEFAGAILIGVQPGNVVWISLSSVLIGFGNGLVIPVVTTGLLEAVDASISGVAGGAFSSVRQFGNALGVAVLGFMVQGVGISVRVDLRSISVVCGAVLAVALATYLVSTGLRTRTKVFHEENAK